VGEPRRQTRVKIMKLTLYREASLPGIYRPWIAGHFSLYNACTGCPRDACLWKLMGLCMLVLRFPSLQVQVEA
jgi:hypothetical protein